MILNNTQYLNLKIDKKISPIKALRDFFAMQVSNYRIFIIVISAVFIAIMSHINA
jgi:hypothetical protein